MAYFVVPDLCRQSQDCIEECPMEAIVFDTDQEIAVIDPMLCTDCGSCADVCPSGAITGVSED